ncbi:hypothetical protein ACFS5L_29145 [Streptomyces phyllanthi]|uniref:Uncharacterized protein n=1 Tax=Streptomyces phyllanthi TaxID=1803180 RepID=A0A5N8W9C3_9ACTN|nr:hypothetical protein [Streptomyces phyllanthi]MPY43702.1 hypothetical protein [Streptomyces phyllanthi]
MGDRLSGDGVTGRRRVHPGDAVPGPWDPCDDVALRTVLAAAMRASDLAPEAEQRAVAAFRAARGAGAHRARTRRRDDWRLPAERRARRSVKATSAAVFTSLALGGVAVAAIGSAGSHSDGTGRSTPRPSVAAPARPGGETSPASSGGLGARDGSSSARDTEAHCRAYEQVQDSGKALDATAWQQLVAAAGGEDEVAAYCAEQLARATATPSRSGDTGRPTAGAADAGTETAGNTGTSGNGNPGNAPGGADDAAGNGRAGGGKDE